MAGTGGRCLCGLAGSLYAADGCLHSAQPAWGLVNSPACTGGPRPAEGGGFCTEAYELARPGLSPDPNLDGQPFLLAAAPGNVVRSPGVVVPVVPKIGVQQEALHDERPALPSEGARTHRNRQGLHYEGQIAGEVFCRCLLRWPLGPRLHRGFVRAHVFCFRVPVLVGVACLQVLT